jgi:23S rRNA pseudouridine1911/1915/1917 synthase
VERNPFVHVVAPEDDGLPLRTVLRHRMGLSRTLVIRLKRKEDGILLNGVRTPVNAKVRAGDRVEVRLPEETAGAIEPEPIPIDVLYEDDDLLVVNKPAGLVVHPTRGFHGGTLANGVIHHWRQRGLSIRFRPVHRLDRDTSGVLAIAKNAFVHERLSRQLQAGRVEKTYCAFVFGRPDPPSGIVEAPIGQSADRPGMRVVRPDGAPSVTRYETVESWGAVSLLRVRPVTGRTHQIRVHMRHIGHPIVGDPLYAADRPPPPGAGIGRQALHAVSLGFEHPVTGRRVTFRAPLPADLVRLMGALAAPDNERSEPSCVD